MDNSDGFCWFRKNGFLLLLLLLDGLIVLTGLSLTVWNEDICCWVCVWLEVVTNAVGVVIEVFVEVEEVVVVVGAEEEDDDDDGNFKDL